MDYTCRAQIRSLLHVQTTKYPETSPLASICLCLSLQHHITPPISIRRNDNMPPTSPPTSAGLSDLAADGLPKGYEKEGNPQRGRLHLT